MGTEDQLEREARLGRYAAAAAFGAIALSIGALIYQSATLKPIHLHGHTIRTPKTEAQLLLLNDHQPTAYLVTQIINALALPLIAAVLYYLYSVTRARRADLPPVIGLFALVAPPLAGVFGIANQVRDNHLAHQFARSGRTAGKAGVDYANHLVLHTGASWLGYVQPAVMLLLTIAIVLTAVFAMRTGLLSRGMGILGIAVGAFTILPLFGQATVILEVFWLGALGMLFLNRWPGGRGPAWSALEAVPWPTPTDRRRQIAEQADAAQPAPEPEPEPMPVTAGAPSHPRSKKRKRKRR